MGEVGRSGSIVVISDLRLHLPPLLVGGQDAFALGLEP
jgi:hypothetical protein